MRFFRKIGLFDATIYLECSKLDGGNVEGQDGAPSTSGEYEHLNYTSTVHIIGEFSPEKPWQVPVQCNYVPKLRCFKVDIMVRQGQQFKFTIDYGKTFLVSDRYPIQTDKFGNQFNVFLPKEINRRCSNKIKIGRANL